MASICLGRGSGGGKYLVWAVSQEKCGVVRQYFVRILVWECVCLWGVSGWWGACVLAEVEVRVCVWRGVVGMQWCDLDWTFVLAVVT